MSQQTTGDRQDSPERLLLLLGLMLYSMVLLVAWQPWPGAGAGAELVKGPSPAMPPIDINHSPAVSFVLLEGVGPKLAERIVEERERNGPFARIEELARVRGISARMVEGWRPRLSCSASTASPGPDRSASGASP